MSEREMLEEAISNGLDIDELLKSINSEIIQFMVYMTSHSSRYYNIMFLAMPRYMQMEMFVSTVEDAAIKKDLGSIMYVAGLMGVEWDTVTGVFKPTGDVADDICLTDLTRRWLASDQFKTLPKSKLYIRTVYKLAGLWKEACA